MSNVLFVSHTRTNEFADQCHPVRLSQDVDGAFVWTSMRDTPTEQLLRIR